MTVRDFYNDAIAYNYYSLQLVIEFLVYEKKVIRLEDPKEKLEFYLQEKFHKKMNELLKEYEMKKNGTGAVFT